jgi:hypothetical protein
MPPKKWMTIAPGVEARSARGPKNMNASSRPRPGPGFDSSMNRIERPVSSDCAVPSGVSTPWLIALLRNSTLPGSMISEASGSRLWSTSQPTPLSAQPIRPLTTGPIPKNPPTASAAPAMPAEKLSTSISKPAGVFGWRRPSIFFCTQAASGPMIIAPRNIGVPAPTITPMVAMAPTTPPRWPCTILPPVNAISSGSR